MSVENLSLTWVLPIWLVLGFVCGTLARTLAAAALPVSGVPASRLPLLSCPVCSKSLLRAAVLWPGSSRPARLAGAPHEGLGCEGCSTSARAFLAAEAGGAATFALLTTRLGGLDLVVASASAIVLLTLFLTDVAYRLIPNRILYPAAIGLFAAQSLIRGPTSPLIGALVCGGFFLAVYLLGVLISATIYQGRLVFGLGDVKLACFVGLLVGWPAALTALALTVLAGAGLALLWIVRGRVRESLPYGTALAIGAVLTMLIDVRAG